MAKRKIFYSFHYKNDVMRVQQIRNIGALEENKPVTHNDWETVKGNGDLAIKRWIDANMENRTCVVVLIGEDTHSRPWVKYEINKAHEDGRSLLGVYIHNLKDPTHGKGTLGKNPFDQLKLKDKNGNPKIILCKNPSANETYKNIKENLEIWIEEAIALK